MKNEKTENVIKVFFEIIDFVLQIYNKNLVISIIS